MNLKEFDVGNFEYIPDHLRLGDHTGNRFNIVLRSLHSAVQVPDLEGVVASSLEAVKRHGFVNYFGLQRFSISLTAPRIGLALLRNDVVKKCKC